MTQARTQITLKDVAEAASCSTAVVSTVINGARGNTLVSDELRRRVKKAAARLGYRPNFASQSLVSRRTRTLGVYIPPSPWAGPGFSYESEMLKGIEPACREHEHDLLLINLTGDQSPQACLDKFAQRRIDGVLLVHTESGSPWIQELVVAGCNVVAIDYMNPSPGLNAMIFDNVAAVHLAVDHLISLGHRQIGFLGPCSQQPTQDAIARQDTFMQYVRECGLELPDEWVFDVRRAPRALKADEDVCQREGLWGAQHIVALGSKGPTAWMAYGDLVAVSAMPHLHAGGVRVPEDISLIGVDDSEWCRMVWPQLSSIAHPLQEMGRAAVELLIELSERGESSRPAGARGVHRMFAPQLVARQSTAPLRQS